MAYFYVKALHIIFVVTWFAGLFYIVRLFIYNCEAQDKPETERLILQKQFTIMIKRLWLGITWPSCLLATLFGSWLIYFNYPIPIWLWIKIAFIIGLMLYHFSLHLIYRQQRNGVFRYNSQQLRVWNEVATIFLVAIVFLVVVRTGLSVVWGLGGLIAFIIVLMSAIRIYKRMRMKS